MENQPEIIQVLTALFAVALLAYCVPIITYYLQQHSTPKLAEIAVLPPDQEAKFERWFEHFQQKQIKTAAGGDKALANPLDDSSDGIPTSSELRIFEQMVKSAGYGAHINGSIKPVEHLTIYWQ